MDECEWQLDKDGPGEWWFTACDHQFHGPVTPQADHYDLPEAFVYCPYCAKPIRFDRTERTRPEHG